MNRNIKNIIILRLVLLAVAVLPPAVYAQPYSIVWFTVDGGGAMNVTGGAYALSGTIGQPDAGEVSGGSDVINGGFWGLFALVPPRLTITRVGSNVVICWPSPSTGFRLQQSASLTPTGWGNITQTPTDNGTTKCVTLPAALATTFYRLTN